MNSTHTTLTQTSHQNLESSSGFRGILTKLLHEAFYLEDDFIHTSNSHGANDFIVSEPEEEYDQLNFIQQFLKLRT